MNEQADDIQVSIDKEAPPPLQLHARNPFFIGLAFLINFAILFLFSVFLHRVLMNFAGFEVLITSPSFLYQSQWLTAFGFMIIHLLVMQRSARWRVLFLRDPKLTIRADGLHLLKDSTENHQPWERLQKLSAKTSLSSRTLTFIRPTPPLRLFFLNKSQEDQLEQHIQYAKEQGLIRKSEDYFYLRRDKTLSICFKVIALFFCLLIPICMLVLLSFFEKPNILLINISLSLSGAGFFVLILLYYFMDHRRCHSLEANEQQISFYDQFGDIGHLPWTRVLNIRYRFNLLQFTLLVNQKPSRVFMFFVTEQDAQQLITQWMLLTENNSAPTKQGRFS